MQGDNIKANLHSKVKKKWVNMFVFFEKTSRFTLDIRPKANQIFMEFE